MPNQVKKDNDSFDEKVRYRRRALRLLNIPPIVLEAYGGWGKLNRACYLDLPSGVILERDPRKTEILSQLRPSWAVYEGDTVNMLASGVGREWPISYLDLDPYGEPWPALEAFFISERLWAPQMVVVVHDGLRNTLMLGKAWKVESLKSVVQQHGNKYIGEHYIDVCRELLGTRAAMAGYTIDRWWATYGGFNKQSTHWFAVLNRDVAPRGVSDGIIPTPLNATLW